MDENHNVEKSGTSPTEEEVLARRAEEANERRIDEHIWKNCCELHDDEAYYMRSNLHFAHVLRKQYINSSVNAVIDKFGKIMCDVQDAESVSDRVVM